MKVRVVKDHFCGTSWRAEPETLYLGGVGAVYVEKLEFVLPETWAGMAVTLHIEQEGGTVPQPMLLDGNNNAPVDGRFTTARQGLWMLMATDGEGRREMTMPGKYVCYQTLENGEGTGADGPAMPLRYQYLQLVLEQEARAALEAQRAARYRQWVADRCAAKEHALLLEALSGMRYSDASAWDMIAQLKQRWNSPPPEQAEPVAVESIRLDSKELSIKVGESCPLKATVLPGSAPQTVEWMAEPEGIVQLRENTLTAVKGGTALLTAIAGGKLAQRRVQSVAVSLEKLALDKPSVKLKGRVCDSDRDFDADPVHRDSGELDNEQCGAGRDERPDDRRRKRKGREHAGSPEGRQLHHYCCRRRKERRVQRHGGKEWTERRG